MLAGGKDKNIEKEKIENKKIEMVSVAVYKSDFGRNKKIGDGDFILIEKPKENFSEAEISKLMTESQVRKIISSGVNYLSKKVSQGDVIERSDFYNENDINLLEIYANEKSKMLYGMQFELNPDFVKKGGSYSELNANVISRLSKDDRVNIYYDKVRNASGKKNGVISKMIDDNLSIENLEVIGVIPQKENVGGILYVGVNDREYQKLLSLSAYNFNIVKCPMLNGIVQCHINIKINENYITKEIRG